MIGTIQGGRYRILRKLGEGGMGEVYLAEHINLGRHDALKIVHRELASDPEFVSRFRREARATNRLGHPNIVVVYDFGRLDAGRFFLAMEYVEGELLSHLVRRTGKLQIPRALGLLGQLASAMDHAHSRGVVHRDLRPDNIIVEARPGDPDRIKVLDFGLAKIIAPDYFESVGLSRKGQIFGTPAYMAPEQLRGISGDPRVDIYALGCVAFELVTGSQVFLGRPMEVMSAQATRAPEVPSRRQPKAGISESLDAIILRCLEKDPARRFQSGRDLLVALERVPGFPSESHRLKGHRLIRRGRTPSSDFDVADTEITPPPGDLPRGMATPEAEPQRIHDPAWYSAMRDLCETFVDSGGSDVRMVMELAHLKEIEDDDAKAQAELAALDSQAQSLEQSVRQRESSIRFAIGELHFVRSEDMAQGGGPPEDLERQIAELEERLRTITRDFNRELSRLTDEAIALAALRANLSEKLDATYGLLEKLLTQSMTRHPQSAMAARFKAQLQKLQTYRQSPP